MTQFVFNLFNHNPMGQRSLEDVIGIFGHQIRALGHEAVWDNRNEQFVFPQDGINVIVEGFTPSSIAAIGEAHRQGCRFICLATEEPIVGKGFNHGEEREMRERMMTFPHAMQYFEGILYLVPGQHVQDWYGQWAPSAYVELGFAPTLLRDDVRITPKFDFGFYGSLTNRRHKILKRLAKVAGTENAVRILADFPSQTDRDVAMRDCRVVVQIRKYDSMGLVSSSRCNTALCLGRPVLAEPHDLCKPWDEVIDFSDNIEEFYKDALYMRMNWRGRWFKQLEAFKREFSPERCVGEPLKAIKLNMEHAPAYKPETVVGDVVTEAAE